MSNIFPFTAPAALKHATEEPMGSLGDIATKLQMAHDTYYTQHKKNLFVKKDQKFACAAATSQQYNIQQLIQSSVFVIPDTNRIFMDYPVFKLYANPENYSLIVAHFISLIDGLIRTHNSFEMHLNIKSYTVSAAERYMPLIRLFCELCLKDTSLSRSDKMTYLHTYHTPAMIGHIVPMIMKVSVPGLNKKLVHYNKDESDGLMSQLLSSVIPVANTSNDDGENTTVR